jgi:enoyl-CoA hydratase/carnithine racemase
MDLGNDDLAVEVSDDELVIRATIDRPEKRNALSGAVLDGLEAVCDAADEGPARAVVVRGAGETFCSGGDLTGMDAGEGGGSQARRKGVSGLAELVDRMADTDALTVAAVEGYCLAGGLGLAAACEFVVAEADATFGTPEVNVGLFPAQAMAPIMRAVQEKRGLKLLFTGEFVDAEEAYDMGVVTDVAPEGAFEETLDDLVDELAANSPVMISMGKEAYYQQRDMDFQTALSYLKEMFALVTMSEDAEEGIAAFAEDRDPEWKGR